MCGITGLFSQKFSRLNLLEFGRGMTNALRHRGPDDAGEWAAKDAPLFFGHRRLSIVDLSPLGHQPMSSVSGRFEITFNGEIYNYQYLKKELEELGHHFRGTSDTEVMLASFEQWGVREAVERFVGMFAFGLWDHKERRLYLSRDRFGEKPLYYTWQRGYFCFASELKAIALLPEFDDSVDRGALAGLANLGYIPGPASIYSNTFKLPQASILSLSEADLLHRPEKFSPYATAQEIAATPRLYWNLAEVAQAKGGDLALNEQEWIALIEDKLKEAIRLQMVADVPVGAFLSGGVDSSTIVALMQQQSTLPVRTFSIGFADALYNEAPFAAKVARHLGTTHTEMTVTPNDCLDVIPRLPFIYDEPFADSSHIPTFLVSQLARSQVTVCLSGDAGDELFAGYLRYAWANRLYRMSSHLPKGLTRVLSRLAEDIPYPAWSLIGQSLRWFALGKSVKDPGTKARRVAELLDSKDFPRLYRRIASLWSDKLTLVHRATPLPTALNFARLLASFVEPRELAMFTDQLLYLPDDILPKVDRAAMAVSLESRVPFLDHRLVEATWKLPFSFKVRNGETKWILRHILEKYVPKKLFDRPKMGFAVPLDSWLRGPLREWAEDLLSEKRLEQQGFFDAKIIRREWELHLAGKTDRQYALWPVLMFEAWLASRDYQKSNLVSDRSSSSDTHGPI